MAARKIRKMGQKKDNPFAKKGSAKKGEQKSVKCPKCGATISI